MDIKTSSKTEIYFEAENTNCNACITKFSQKQLVQFFFQSLGVETVSFQIHPEDLEFLTDFLLEYRNKTKNKNDTN